MRYILADHIALRSWRFVPYAYYEKGVRLAKGLSAEEYGALRCCDGEQETEDTPLLRRLAARGLCRPAKPGEKLTAWQRERVCDNRYFPAINWMITGRCNYNCLHCFNAADNERLQSEFTWEEAEKLICEAEECGVNAFTITGGEPMLHPRFMDILRGIHARGMYVEELNTNGFFLTQEILDEMKAIGCNPLMKISFDGLGCHDWLRNRAGAEEDALRAIRLCLENGFRVKAQTNVHRLNIQSMLPTAEALDEMGVQKMRIIRTTESPRWRQNAGGACLTLEEYFDGMLAFIREYTRKKHCMNVDIWQFAYILPQSRYWHPRSMVCAEGQYRDTLPVCRGNRAMAAIGANGNLYPCHQMSGYYDLRGWVLGNVKTEGLQKHLREGEYLRSVCMTVGELKRHNEKCAACPWFKYCCGGCRVMGAALTEDMMGEDLSKCLFFKNGYLEKLRGILPDWRM